MTYITKITAIDPFDGELKEWEGPRVQAITFKNARQICKQLYPYAEITGMLVKEVDAKTGETTNDQIFWN